MQFNRGMLPVGTTVKIMPPVGDWLSDAYAAASKVVESFTPEEVKKLFNTGGQIYDATSGVYYKIKQMYDAGGNPLTIENAKQLVESGVKVYDAGKTAYNNVTDLTKAIEVASTTAISSRVNLYLGYISKQQIISMSVNCIKGYNAYVEAAEAIIAVDQDASLTDADLITYAEGWIAYADAIYEACLGTSTNKTALTKKVMDVTTATDRTKKLATRDLSQATSTVTATDDTTYTLPTTVSSNTLSTPVKVGIGVGVLAIGAFLLRRLF